MYRSKELTDEVRKASKQVLDEMRLMTPEQLNEAFEKTDKTFYNIEEYFNSLDTPSSIR